MRYLLGILALFFIVSCKSVPSVSDSPLQKKMLKAYPERLFISKVGMGESLEAARNDGAFQISAYLKAEIQSDLQADTRELFIDSDEGTYSSTVDYVVTDITISSDIELPTLEFSEPYVDGETGTWMVCAYINREKALNKLKPEILELESEFNTSLSLAENETEPFVKICSYKKALATAKKLTEKIVYANLFSSAETDFGVSVNRNVISSVSGKLVKLQQENPVLIKVENDYNNMVYNALEGFFKGMGFNIVRAGIDASYTAGVLVGIEKEKQGDSFILVPGAKMGISGKDGEVYSFTYSTGRIVLYNEDLITGRCYKKLSEEIGPALNDDFERFLNRG